MESLDMPVGQLEGSLPPCVRVAVFDGRRAFMRDNRKCKHDFSDSVYLDDHDVVALVDTFEGVTPDSGGHEDKLVAQGRVPAVWSSRLKAPSDEEVDALWLEAQEVLLGGAE